MTNAEKHNAVLEVLEATGLNWTLSLQDLYAQKGRVRTKLPELYKGIQRSDNDQVLGVVSSRYEIMQNHEAVHLLLKSNDLFDPNGDFSHPWDNAATLGSYGNIGGGSLGNGERIFLQLKLDDVKIGKSDIRRFITLTNRHDGKGSLGFGTTNQVVCCANTFAIANKDVKKFRHSASLQERLDMTMENIDNILKFEELQLEIFEALTTQKITKKAMEETKKIALQVKDLEDLSTRKENQLVLLEADIEKSIEEQGQNRWALFNGVTRFTNHTTERKDKVESLLFESDAKINRAMFDQALQWTN